MRTVDTYDRFHRHITAWVDGEIDPLIVLGPPGVGKSYAYQTCLGNRRHHRFGGRLTPLQAYLRLYDEPDLPVVLDDISALFRDNDFRDMLKALCESGRREVRWGTTTSKLDGRAHWFVCTSPVLIVLNKLPSGDPDVLAVLDRCDTIRFEPTKAEIIQRMYTIFPQNSDLIDLLADLPAMPSLRTLVKARRWQKSKYLNLIEELLSECGVAPPVVQLARIMESSPEAEWCERYIGLTGLTDRTYRRHRQFAQQLVDCRAARNGCPNVRVNGDSLAGGD